MFAQLVFNSIVSGLLIALVAVGFNLIFNTTKVLHIAHGAIYVAGAYCFWWLFNMEIGLVKSIAATVLAIILLTVLIEFLIYRQLEEKKTGQPVSLICSMGLYLFLVNLLAMLFGNRSIIIHPEMGNNISAFNLSIVPIQALQLVTCIVVIILFLWQTRSKWFLKVRAVMSDTGVASVMGVNTFAIRLYAMILGSLFAVLASILTLYDIGLNPQSGMAITLTAVVAVIVGGTTSFKGTVAASLLIAFLQTGTEWYLSAQWKEGVTFLLLISVILWRTQGIVSFKMRVEEQ